MGDKYEQMRQELMCHTLKELKAIAKQDGVCLGYDGSRKDTCVGAIVSYRRHKEMES